MQAIANTLVLATVTGKDYEELSASVPDFEHHKLRVANTLFSSLKKADSKHQLLTDLAEKSEAFDKAASKYKAKVAA